MVDDCCDVNYVLCSSSVVSNPYINEVVVKAGHSGEETGTDAFPVVLAARVLLGLTFPEARIGPPEHSTYYVLRST